MAKSYYSPSKLETYNLITNIGGQTVATPTSKGFGYVCYEDQEVAKKVKDEYREKTEKYKNDPEKNLKFTILNYRMNEPRDLELNENIFPRIFLYTKSSGSGIITYFPFENNTPIFLLKKVPLFILFLIKIILLSNFLYFSMILTLLSIEKSSTNIISIFI